MNISITVASALESRSWLHIFILIVFLVATLIVLAAYSIVIKIFLKYRKTDFNNQFYILAVNLAIADCLCLCYFGIALFLAMLGRAKWTLLAWHQPILATYFAAATLTFAMAINRLVAVVIFQSYAHIFNAGVTLAVTILCWLLGFSVYLSMVEVGCLIPFHDFAFVYVCDKPLNTTSVMINFAYNQGVSLVASIGTAVCYAIIVAARRKLLSNLNEQVGSNDERKQEWKLVIQGMLISGLFVIYVLTYWSMYLWHLFDHIPPQAVELGVMTLQIAVPATNPLCYITCSSKVRKHFLKMFGTGTPVVPIVSVVIKTEPQMNRTIK